jgi:hypothetical protein
MKIAVASEGAKVTDISGIAISFWFLKRRTGGLSVRRPSRIRGTGRDFCRIFLPTAG